MCKELTDLEIAKRFISKAQNARDRGIEFTLPFTSFKNLMRAKRCFYTGVPMIRPDGAAQTANSVTVDRVDASKGYVAGNVVACCFAFNQAKATMERRCAAVPDDLIAKGLRKLFAIQDKKA